MGDEPRSDVGKITSESSQSVSSQALPALLQVLTQAAPQLAKTQVESAQTVSPAYNKLLASLYQQYAPQLAKTGSDVENISRTGAANTDLAILSGAGGAAARQAEGLEKELNPEYEQGKTAALGKLGELLSSINLGNANPEAERLVSQENARSGNLATPSATGTVANALSFGNELQKRRNALGSALSIASGLLPATKSNFGQNVALNSISRAPTNTGVSEFAGVKGTEAGPQALGAGVNLFGTTESAGTTAAQIAAQRRDWIDRVNESIGSVNV